MSLILEGAALAIDGAALIIDCACCIKELCDKRACVTESDCDEAALQPGAECFCRGNECTSDPSCTDDDDCPDGLICLNGMCVSPCQGQPCGTDGDCPEVCVCVDGGCYDPDSIYYCWKQVKDEQGNNIPTADQELQCSQGVPIPPMYSQGGGPFLSYALCAASGCGAKFSCNPVICDCYPDPAGPYEEISQCQSECCGGTGDLGRCCASTVCYDADGNVTEVTQQCDECCGGGQPPDLQPIDPDNPDAGLRCVNTVPCKREDCISDGRLQNGQAGCRTFRQFNTLFDNCDLCATSLLGPCCYEVEGVAICDMQDKGTCEDVLNGEWKGNNWFTCEDARDSQVDLLLDFACPNCNGEGDCACGGNGYCYGQKCLDCINPTTVNTDAEGTIIDNNPKAGDKWKFRVRSCTDGVSYPEQDVNIFAERPDGTKKLVTTINNRDGEIDSFGRTLWTFGEEECFRFLVAQKMVGNPDEVQLCMEKEAAGNPLPPPGCEPPSGMCPCPDPELPGCPDDQRDLVYTYGPSEAPPQERWKFKDSTTPECRAKYAFMWYQETGFQSYDEEIPCEDFFVLNTVQESFGRFKYLMWKPGPGGGWTDVTDQYVEGLPYTPPGYNEVPNGLSIEIVDEFNGCDGIVQSVAASEGLVDIPIPCEVPDLNANCPQSRNMRSENPLP